MTVGNVPTNLGSWEELGNGVFVAETGSFVSIEEFPPRSGRVRKRTGQFGSRNEDGYKDSSRNEDRGTRTQAAK